MIKRLLLIEWVFVEGHHQIEKVYVFLLGLLYFDNANLLLVPSQPLVLYINNILKFVSDRCNYLLRINQ